ncbi:MAG: bifunctional nuclease family protein [Bacteroidetes bacterium]|nr:bifunctional nuclease family protein [Bacteroidota bacterium]
MASEEKIYLEVVGLTSGQTQGSYTLILGEIKGKRKLAIIIGAFEAQAIAIEIEKIVPFRPMTHDLFLHLTREFDITVSSISIYDLKEGVFYARLSCEKDGLNVDIDCRTSDAISLAVRYKCPIYTYGTIMDQAGFEQNVEGMELDEDDDEEDDHIQEVVRPSRSNENEFSNYTEEEIQTMLDEAIRDEDYGRAAQLRDELEKRK